MPTIRRLIFRLFRLSEDEQHLLNRHFEERMKLPGEARSKYAVPKNEFENCWRLVYAWGLIVTYGDDPKWLLFTFLVPIFILICILQEWGMKHG